MLFGVGAPAFGPLRRPVRILRRNLPSLNFITLHYTYFLVTCLISSGIFWGASTPPRSVSYADSLFLVVSAMTLAGLNTVNLSTLNTFQQFMLFFLIIIGSAVFVSAFVVHVRKRAFERRFAHVLARRRRRAEGRGSGEPIRHPLRSLSRSSNRVGQESAALESKDPCKRPGEEGSIIDVPTGSVANGSTFKGKSPDTDTDTYSEADQIQPTDAASRPKPHRTITYRSEAGDEIHVNPNDSPDSPPAHITFGPNVYFHVDSGPSKHSHQFMSMQGVGANPHATIKRRSSQPQPRSDGELEPLESINSNLPYTSYGFLSRNSHFHHLSEAEREKLGGYEYRAIRLLSWLVPAYFILFQLFGCLGVGAYVAINKPTVARANGLNPWWLGSFNAVSAFNNSGMSLLDANMVAFQTSIYMLITMGLLILAGNTCYPIFLRLIVWSLLKLLPKHESREDLRKTLQFLLDHPRRCYTNLFPSRHTWWLLSCVVCLNGIDWAAFEVLNIGNNAITSLPTGIQVLDGLFQALAVRSGGFYVVPISSVRISLQVLYVIMMYISAYPVVITMRHSNVYEERSLGIYTDHDTSQDLEHTKSYFIRQQLRAQLAHDLWCVVLAVFVIMIIEGSNFSRDPAVYSVFNVIFDTVSGYGCVGISVGLPTEAYSFCGGLHTLSKLVLCVVMIRGRHRGLPVAIDKAILLPGEGVDDAEEEDGEIRMERTIGHGRIV